MATKKKMLQAAAGVGGEPEGAWDLSYAYYDDPLFWNISSASFLNGFYIGGQELTAQGLFFKPDGTKFYIIGNSQDAVLEYSMSTAWDVATATYIRQQGVSAQDASPQDVFFSPDGIKMYVLGNTGDDVNEYTLSTAWDIQSATYVQNFSIAAQDTTPQDMFFSPDGTKMYMLGSGNDRVNEYSLSTAWDISTASYVQFFSVAAQETSPVGLFFKPDGFKMYVSGGIGDDVNEYALSTAWDISTASYVQAFSVAAQTTFPSAVFFKPDGSKMYILDETNDIVRQYTLGGFSVAAQEINPTDLFFMNDGLKMYIIGATGDDVNEYDLSTAWDTSTASYLQSFYVGSQDTNPTGLFFKPDGTKMYVLGNTGDDVNEYDLSTAWDVSTASYVQNFSVSGQETVPSSIFFKPDGTKMYVIGSSSDNVNEYDLSVAWNIATASYLQSFNVNSQQRVPTGIFFKPDGTKMYIIGSSAVDVDEYDLSAAWDVSTASYVQNFSVDAQDGSPSGVFFKDDGTKMFMLGLSSYAVFTYTLGVQE